MTSMARTLRDGIAASCAAARDFARHRSGADPYASRGVSYAPAALERALRTPDDVRRCLAEAQAVYGRGAADVASSLGVPVGEVEAVVEGGVAPAARLVPVLRAFGVVPVCLPREAVASGSPS